MWKSAIIAVLLTVASSTGEAPHNPPATDTAQNVWYTQIGTWHLIRDTLVKKAHLYHNAAVDGAQSGLARADLKYNRRINDITRLHVDLSLGQASTAGVLLKDKRLAYGIYLVKGDRIDSVRIIRRFEKLQTTIARFAIAASDTQRLDVTLRADSLRVNVGSTTRSIRKPADLPMDVIVALSCEQGAVRVWGVRIDAASATIAESFDQATIISLGMERMFQAGRKNASSPRTTSSPK